jgi:hypothetical protein
MASFESVGLEKKVRPDGMTFEEVRLLLFCGSGFPAATILAESHSHK